MTKKLFIKTNDCQINEYDSVIQINKVDEPVTDTGNPTNRYHSGFASQMEYQKEIAAIILLEICSNCFESYADFEEAWSLPIVETDRMQVLEKQIKAEQQRTMQYLPVTLLGETQVVKKTVDTRTLKEILHDEKVLESFLEKKRAYLKQVLAPKQLD